MLVPDEAAARPKIRGTMAENFFDFEQAKAWWRDLPYEEAAKMRAACEESPHWTKWEDKLLAPHHKEEVEKEIAWTPAAATVRRCSDLDLNWRVFEAMYETWRENGHPNGWEWPRVEKNPKQWSTMETHIKYMSKRNVFTRNAEDMPDWRSPEQRAKDAAALEAFRAKKPAVNG